MTTIYFGQVPSEFADDSDYFEYEGAQYYFKLEYYPTEEYRFARLYDTAGRMVPVDADHFQHMASSFALISQLEADMVDAHMDIKMAKADIAEASNWNYGIK